MTPPRCCRSPQLYVGSEGCVERDLGCTVFDPAFTIFQEKSVVRMVNGTYALLFVQSSEGIKGIH